MPGRTIDEETVDNTDQPHAGPGLPLVDLTSYPSFCRLFDFKNTLGVGGDGAVHLYAHRISKASVVVKVSRNNLPETRDALAKEIENFKALGRHDNIVAMLTYSHEHDISGTAIFLELCELGDLYSFRKQWCMQQAAKGKPQCPLSAHSMEATKDMSLALDFLHYGHETCYVHNDLKPGNILVKYPKNWDMANGLPSTPLFKLTDFARVTPFPTPPGAEPQNYDGTPEFRPPIDEQKDAVEPCADIWSLGATIQSFALDISPIQSRDAFIRSRHAQGKTFPDVSDFNVWRDQYWRWRRPTVYRPLNVSAKELRAKHDMRVVPVGWKPYHEWLTDQYDKLWERDPAKRISARKLATEIIPWLDGIVLEARDRVVKENEERARTKTSEGVVVVGSK